MLLRHDFNIYIDFVINIAVSNTASQQLITSQLDDP